MDFMVTYKCLTCQALYEILTKETRNMIEPHDEYCHKCFEFKKIEIQKITCTSNNKELIRYRMYPLTDLLDIKRRFINLIPLTRMLMWIDIGRKDIETVTKQSDLLDHIPKEKICKKCQLLSKNLILANFDSYWGRDCLFCEKCYEKFIAPELRW